HSRNRRGDRRLMPAPHEVTRHTLSVLVEDVEGITSRVAGMFTRRGYNLVSIVSARTETPGINRFTIVVDASEVVIEQETKQLNKIITVIKVVEMKEESAGARGIMLVKVIADSINRPQVVDAVNFFRARVVVVAQESDIVEFT